MIGAISSNPIGAVSGKPTRSSPALEAQLANARNQLVDRSTSFSARSSAGKEKIRQVSQKVEDIELQIKQADAAAQQRKTTDGTAAVDESPNGTSAFGTASRSRGLVDTYA
jgi:hypothetical protein